MTVYNHSVRQKIMYATDLELQHMQNEIINIAQNKSAAKKHKPA